MTIYSNSCSPNSCSNEGTALQSTSQEIHQLTIPKAPTVYVINVHILKNMSSECYQIKITTCEQ
ncbi:hypothetical protein OUZ56_024078 [Daphnia magna]|uniref:Uncharacterized protein n=1 Tax=Daphnia magna TaxID=35525 RepID=A0ABR0B029_9CRUS|nr:hypothetical protein OUZ56_024078 [Daphnia magna]